MSVDEGYVKAEDGTAPGAGTATERAAALRGAGQFAEAEAVLQPELAEPLTVEAVLVEYARIANDQGDWANAVPRWRGVVQRFPANVFAHAALVNALTAALRFDEAEAESATLLERHPDEVQARWAAAWCAHERSVWDLAASRWQAVLDTNPDDVPAVCCRITALTNDGRDQEADLAAEAALQRFKANVRVAEACAWIPHKRGNWSLAAVRWRRVTALAPDNATAYACLATALRALGRHDPAERALLQAIALSPDDFALRTDYALSAQQRGDAAEARRRWQALRERYADDPDKLGQIGHHEMRAGLLTLESAEAAATTPADKDERSLLLTMEGLGDNCEFGMLQRRFGAEPLGLLRFAGITLAELIAALAAQFAGVGARDQMRIEVTSAGEYMVHDAFGIRQHTFVYRHEMAEDRFRAQTSRRLMYLRDKLLEDLRQGDKLFVFRVNQITRTEALALHEAMRSYGDPHLLCVTQAQEDHVAGSMQVVQPGLMLGYLSRFARNVGLQDSEYREWLAVCRAAHAQRSAWRQESSQA